MTVLVTGGAGFVAAHLVLELEILTSLLGFLLNCSPVEVHVQRGQLRQAHRDML